MATRRYKLNQGERLDQIVEEVGAATNSKNIEVTVDFAASPAPTKLDVINALELIKQWIEQAHTWPPA